MKTMTQAVHRVRRWGHPRAERGLGGGWRVRGRSGRVLVALVLFGVAALPGPGQRRDDGAGGGLVGAHRRDDAAARLPERYLAA